MSVTLIHVLAAEDGDAVVAQDLFGGVVVGDTVKDISRREKQLVDGFKSMLGLAVHVHLVSPKTIERSEGKAKRVIDKRHLV